MLFRRLGDIDRDEVIAALKAGQLELSLGPFTMRLRGDQEQLHKFILDVYRDAGARTKLGDATDVSVHVRAPSLVRKYLRPQVIPDPGFIVPAVPLPARMSPLALEMGLNLSVALKVCRFVSFHAAAVANEKGSILISAHSGGGKSTLAAALMQEGFNLFSDEFGLVGLDDAKLRGYPRPVSLKDASIDIITERTGRDWVTETFSGTPKGNLAYRRVRPADIKAADTPKSAKLVLFPVFGERLPNIVKPLSPSEAAMRLIPSSTNYHLLGELGFRAMTSLVSEAKAFEIQYRSTGDSIAMAKDLASGVGLL